MRNKIKAVTGNPLITGSFFIFSGGILASFLSFIFNLLMSRNLTVPDYGELVSIISIAILLSIPAQAVIPTIVSISEPFFEKGENEKLRGFYIKILKPFAIAGVVLILLSFIFSGIIASFLNISNSLLTVCMGIITLLTYLGLVNIGFLQARLSFKSISFSNILSAAIKVLFGFALAIFFGMSGALWGYISSCLIPIVVGIFILRKQLFGKGLSAVKFSYRSLLKFGIPSAIVVFCLNAFISTDIILVKHFFAPEAAGLYTGLSLIGRSIFYITTPITTVMFPIITKRYNARQKYGSIVISSFLVVFLSSIFFTVFYYTFPNFIVLFFLKKREFLSISSNVGQIGIFCSLYSLVFLLSYYFLSIKKTDVWKALAFAAAAQAVLISIFHKNFSQIIISSICVLTFLILYLLIRTLRSYRQEI